MGIRDQMLPVFSPKLLSSIVRWVALGCSLTLAGCNSDWRYARERAAQANTAPPAPTYKADIVAFMRTYLNDPSSVRDAFISEPTLRTLENADRYTLCLRYTARKGVGEPYAPSKDSLVLFRDGRFDRVIDTARETCKDAAYQPFHELEKMSRGPSTPVR